MKLDRTRNALFSHRARAHRPQLSRARARPGKITRQAATQTRNSRQLTLHVRPKTWSSPGDPGSVLR
eukprot:4926044-Prymnesium_polylepis.1